MPSFQQKFEATLAGFTFPDSAKERRGGRSRAARAAALLDFAARKLPLHVVQWSLIAKHTLSLERAPNPGSALELAVHNQASAIRRALFDHHGRGLVVIRGVGARATTNADDFMRTQFRSLLARAMSAEKKLSEIQQRSAAYERKKKN